MLGHKLRSSLLSGVTEGNDRQFNTFLNFQTEIDCDLCADNLQFATWLLKRGSIQRAQQEFRAHNPKSRVPHCSCIYKNVRKYETCERDKYNSNQEACGLPRVARTAASSELSNKIESFS